MPRQKLFLVDASNHAYRAYHAIQSDMRTPDGFPTRAIYGFMRIILNLRQQYKPDYIALVFDNGLSFRNTIYPDYKGQRPDMPEDLRRQWPELLPIARASGYAVVDEPDTEADDMIGTLAVRYASADVEVKIVSGDKDFCQLVNENISILDLKEGRELGVKEVEERWGVPPDRIIDLLSLMGDASDNVPGVPGVGEKKAAQFLQKYGSLAGVMAHARTIGGKTGQSLVDSVAVVALAKQLVTIKTDMPLALSLEDLRPGPADRADLAARLTRFNFKGLIRELGVEGVAPVAAPTSGFRPVAPVTVWGPGPLGALAKRLREGDTAIHLYMDEADSTQIQAINLAWPHHPGASAMVPWDEEAQALLGPALATAALVAFDSKSVMKRLRRAGVPVGGVTGDPQLADYLLAPDQRHEWKDVAERAIGAPPVLSRGEHAQLTVEMARVQAPALREQSLTAVLEQIELPLVPILAGMEEVGIPLDTGELGGIGQELEGRMQTLATEIHGLAGREFNLNSTQQVAALLYDELGLSAGRKTKSGRSTDAETLERLDHPIARALLSWRELSKLKSTYIDALPRTIGADGRVHTTFAQTVAATGRLSSADPNLQNIPIRTEEGRRIRHCFVAAPGTIFLSADYSQIELRLLAHFCGEGPLLESFVRGEDIHRRTASEIFSTALDLVTPEQRRAAKAINFGIIYGMGATRLADELGVPRADAQRYMDGYFARQPQVKVFMDRCIQQARDLGWSQTLYGRRRPVAGITASNPMDRAAGERIAMNTPIQGTAADLIKMAMVKLPGVLAGSRARLLLQVHDELLFEVPPSEAEELGRRVRELMEGVASLRVPLKVEVGTGATWDSAH